ncbi:MAG: cobyrinate a,c-diamide synthase [Akkermansia sp.]|uniref:cobyrinate a,c-diamide synthase n=1 Tax=Akkermansia sp. TaxID=1872421 RepID=UPI0025C533DE|nr:cobyrinate a,c-diamide synthase [Akkermansia sp.]MBS5508784.1 cobyrinate a,c-diamide synthase [Akkermansia sp.]MCD8065223.1 cobyrinate a,c-diamide synthase [Akkermansia sp.]
MNKPFHAFCIASTQSGGGKTTVSLALMAALSVRGLRVQAFKCGPDYIDPSFHRQATGLPSFNLDTWMMGKNGVRTQWARHASCADIAICEGVMGLFDARSPESLEGSTADCALTLGLPVLLVVQARGMAGSISAVVRGFSQHHPGLNIAGVIANGVGSAAHADLLRRALDRHGMPPLVAAFPNNSEWTLPERQLGLVPAEEEARQQSWFHRMAAETEKRVNWELLMNITESRRPEPLKVPLPSAPSRGILAAARDNAFCFYYEDNLERLRQTGWDITCFSPLEDAALPEGAKALYLGGGYPEIFADRLEGNEAMRKAILDFARNGGEIFAECGGYMYLCKELVLPDGTRRNMCGVIDGTARMGQKLRSLGYREAVMETEAPFGLPSTRIRGHEFHWSRIELNRPYPPLYTVADKNGNTSREGVADKNVKAGYIHLYWGTEIPDHPQEPQPGLGRVILLNGASSAGKSTLARTMQRLMKEEAMIFSMDDYLAMSRGRHENALDAVRETGLPFIESFHAAIAEAARKGALVIVDHVIGESSVWVRDLLNRLSGIPRSLVRVECRQDILLGRERCRTDRTPDPAHAERQHGSIHRHFPHDLSIDTSEATPQECAMELINRLPREFLMPQE